MSPELRLVDPESGELLAPGCPDCRELATKVAGLETDLTNAEKELRSYRAKNKALIRERDAERLSDPKRVLIESIHEEWQTKLGKPKSGLTADRHDAYKKALVHYSREHFSLVIDALAAYPYEVYGRRRAQGAADSLKIDLGWACEKGRRFEELANLGAELRRDLAC